MLFLYYFFPLFFLSCFRNDFYRAFFWIPDQCSHRGKSWNYLLPSFGFWSKSCWRLLFNWSWTQPLRRPIIKMISKNYVPIFEAGFKVQQFTFFGGYHPIKKFTFSDFEDSGTPKSYRDINVEGTINSLGVSYRTQYLDYNIE